MPKLPSHIIQEALDEVDRFNEANHTHFDLLFRGNFAYLQRIENQDIITKIGRLKYIPKDKRWEFAVFKYSSEKYDPNEWAFPGSERLDGSIKGTLEAGMELYPSPSNFGGFPI